MRRCVGEGSELGKMGSWGGLGVGDGGYDGFTGIGLGSRFTFSGKDWPSDGESETAEGREECQASEWICRWAHDPAWRNSRARDGEVESCGESRFWEG